MLSGFVLLVTIAMAAGNSVLMDASGSLNRLIPDVSTSDGIVAVVSSPDTPSFLGEGSAELLCWDESSNRLTCRGATLNAATAPERTSLGTTSLVADSIILDGITEGDVEMDLRMSRHARTLTALIRARLAMDSPSKQTLVLGVLGPVDEAVASVLADEVQSLFEATAAEASKDVEFEDMYEVVVVPVQSQSDASQVRFCTLVYTLCLFYLCLSHIHILCAFRLDHICSDDRCKGFGVGFDSLADSL